MIFFMHESADICPEKILFFLIKYIYLVYGWPGNVYSIINFFLALQTRKNKLRKYTIHLWRTMQWGRFKVFFKTIEAQIFLVLCFCNLKVIFQT